MAVNLDQQAVEVEQTILGAIITDSATIDAWDIRREDFAEPLHGVVYDTVLTAHKAGKPHSAASLVRSLSDLELGDISVKDYVSSVVLQSAASLTPGTAAELRDVAIRRGLRDVGLDVARAMDSPTADTTRDALDARDRIVDLLARAGKKSSSIRFGDAAKAVLESIQSGSGGDHFPIGRGTLDAALGGWHRGQFVILAGRPGMGKSLVATSLALSAARQRCGVLMFSLEMTSSEIASRCLSDLTYVDSANAVPYRLATHGRMNDRDLQAWSRASIDFENLPFLVDDQRALSIAEITARAAAQKTEWERDGGSLDMIVVDHLGLVRPSERYRGNRVQEVSEISDGLATLAKDLNVCVLALSQLNRGTEGRDNKRPTLADLRDSGSLEQDAHVVAFCYRAAYYLERMKCDPGSQQEFDRQAKLDGCRNALEVLIAKNRNGPTESLAMFCDPASNVIRDFDVRRDDGDLSRRMTGDRD